MILRADRGDDASAAISRSREYDADAGGSDLRPTPSRFRTRATDDTQPAGVRHAQA